MPTANSQVNFAHYSRAAFNALGAKNDNTFYVVLEVDGDRTLYLGNVQIDGLKWNAYVPTGRTLAGLDLTANRTRDALLGVNANGFYRRTGANTYDVRSVANLKSDLSLNNVDNTSDANKPISTATQTALSGKQNSLGFTPENVTNKTTTIRTSGADNTKYPTEKAVKDLADTKQENLGFTPYNSTNPSGYQKNSDITKAEIEAKLTGDITTHTHSYSSITGTKPPTDAQKNSNITKAEIEAKLTGAITTHTHSLTGAAITGTLPVSKGGTGLGTIAANSYVKGNGTSALVPITYAQVRTDLSLTTGTIMKKVSFTGGVFKFEVV